MLKALDLLRRLGWAVIDFIYSLIDTLFNIKSSTSNESMQNRNAETKAKKNIK